MSDNNNNTNEEEEEESSSPGLFKTLANADTLAVILGVVTVIGSVITYFMQRSRDRREQAIADKKKDADLDREQALERVRKQLSIFVGPMHRLYKTQTTIVAQYSRHSRHGVDSFMNSMTTGGRSYWMSMLDDDFLQPFIDDPMTFDAVIYRNLVSRRLKPIYTQIRELVLAHASDLADMPTHDEWLQKYSKESITSPHVGSVNINVIFDTYSAWSLEFDDIVESWAEHDFRRMQPTTEVPFLICNDLIDMLYDNAKTKEATYNKHVKVHRNLMQTNMVSQMTRTFGIMTFPAAINNAEKYIEEPA